MVVGFLAGEPTTHWSKLITLKQLRVLHSLAGLDDQMLAGSWRAAHKGH